MPDEDDDFLDGCELDFVEAAVTDQETEFLPLFPQGAETPNLEAKAAMYRVLGESDAV